MVAQILGVPKNRVVCKTKRIGGGFGGKETRSIFMHCAIAVPAYHLQRPVRLCLDRDEDMQMTGQAVGLGLGFGLALGLGEVVPGPGRGYADDRSG